MAQIVIGKVAITPAGTWNKNTSYPRLSEVVYDADGCGYVCLKDNIGVEPGIDETVWIRIVNAGRSIYELAVKYGLFEGTEEEFALQYHLAVENAQNATDLANKAAYKCIDVASTTTMLENTVRANEKERISSENERINSESIRASSETARINNELARQLSTATAVQNCDASKNAADQAATEANAKAKIAQESAELANTKANLAESKANLAQEAADRANELSDHPDYIDETSYHWMKWNEQTKKYEDTGIMATGSPYAEFDIDTTTGQLTIETTNLYGGPTFELNADTGNLEITI